MVSPMRTVMEKPQAALAVRSTKIVKSISLARQWEVGKSMKSDSESRVERAR
jgi:hypothetical protein